MDARKMVTQKVASDWLGISERTLLITMRSRGLLIEGTCWRRKIPQNPNSHTLYDLDTCEEILNGLAKASSMGKDLLNRTKELPLHNEKTYYPTHN